MGFGAGPGLLDVARFSAAVLTTKYANYTKGARTEREVVSGRSSVVGGEAGDLELRTDRR